MNVNKKPKNKNKIAMITAIACLCAVAIFIGVIAVLNISRDMKNQKAVATCGSYDIPYEELRFVTLYYKNELELRHGEGIWDDPTTAEKYRAELEECVISNLNESYAILTICESYNIDPDGDDVKEYVDETIASMIENDFGGDKNEYKKFLEENNMTERLFQFTVKISYLQSAVFYMLVDSGVYMEYTSKNIDEFIDFVEDEDSYARTIHVYIENGKGEDAEKNLANTQMISEELNKITSESERLEKMHHYISNYSEDFKLTTTDGFYFSKNEMDKVYEDQTFALEVGEVSDAFACTDGYYVIMRLAPEDEYVMKNVSTLLTNYQSAQMGLFVQVYRDNYPAAFNEYGKSLDLVAME